MFVQFKNVLDVRRKNSVWHRANRQGVPQRINPRNFTFRSREFEQMELEFFVKPVRARVAQQVAGRTPRLV